MDILGIIAIPFGYVMRFCAWVMQNNYLLAILLFAVIVKIVLFPFGIKQQKNMIKQAKFKPREQAIRDKYAGRTDKKTMQKMNEEIQELYRSEGFSPLAGCLPLLIQFPVLIGLYRVVYNPLVYLSGMTNEAVTNMINFAADKGWMGTGAAGASSTLLVVNQIRDHFGDFQKAFGGEAGFPASPDTLPNFNFFGLDLSGVPSIQNPSWLLIIPVLTFLAMFLSMKLTRRWSYQPQQAQGGCSTNVMDFTMPLISVWMTFLFPALLGIYWIFQSILGVLQQFILSKMFPLPTFTEEDYKEAARIMKGRPAKKTQNAYPGGKKPYNPKSLHHIDDDDYDEHGNYIGDPTGKAYEESDEDDEPYEEPSDDNKNGKNDKNDKNGSIDKAELKDESDYKNNKLGEGWKD